jgi:hypothetical protein
MGGSSAPAGHPLPSDDLRRPSSEEHLQSESPLSGVAPSHRSTAAVPGLPPAIPKARTDLPPPPEGLPPAEEEAQGPDQTGQGEVDEDGNLVPPPAEEGNEEFPMPRPSSLPSRARRSNNPALRRRRPTNVDEVDSGQAPEENESPFPPPESEE